MKQDPRQTDAINVLIKLRFRITHTDSDNNVHMFRENGFWPTRVDVQPWGAVNDLPLYTFIKKFNKNRF